MYVMIWYWSFSYIQHIILGRLVKSCNKTYMPLKRQYIYISVLLVYFLFDDEGVNVFTLRLYLTVLLMTCIKYGELCYEYSGYMVVLYVRTRQIIRYRATASKNALFFCSNIR